MEVITLAVLSDNIEQFLMSLLSEEESPVILVQRNELANYFRCAPSQINYVLATRFTVDRGYTVESRRGGGGYIRIGRIDMDQDSYLRQLLVSDIGTELSEEKSIAILNRLLETECIDKKTFQFCSSLLSDKTIAVPSPIKDRIRANLLRQMAINWIQEKSNTSQV